MTNIDRFRFRYWDSHEGLMTCINELGFYFYEGIFINQYDMRGELFWNEVDSPFIMQCTGIKDKHGVLIYEGDIIRNRFLTYVVEIDTLTYSDNRIIAGEIIGHKFDGKSYE